MATSTRIPETLEISEVSDIIEKVGRIYQYDDKPMRVVFVDSLPPETIARLMALYSRDPSSVMTHLETIAREKSDGFMKKWYVDYGHKSIGDCATISIFIEKVSMLTAKAIQDNSMYSGQETSTRYVDMADQPLVDPINTDESREIHEAWMNFYNDNQAELYEFVKANNPIKEGQNEKVYIKTVKARVFDIMRSFIPAGLTTQLGWHTNVRQAYDKLHKLIYHPDPIIRNECIKILEYCKKTYPSSFNHKTYLATEEYYDKVYSNYTYHENRTFEDVRISSYIDTSDLSKFPVPLLERPPKTELPSFLDDLGNITIRARLDFGSFRDLARHRHGICKMPILTTKLGFHPWYLNQMPQDMQTRALGLIRSQVEKIENLKCTDITRQYYIPMGFMVGCYLSYGLPSFVYVLELRSEKTVHPTLRLLCQQIRRKLDEESGVDIINQNYPYGGIYPKLMKLYVNMDDDHWTIKRGTQDIVRSDDPMITVRAVNFNTTTNDKVQIEGGYST